MKTYTILDAIYNLDQAWKLVTPKNLSGVWQPLLKRPNVVNEPPVEEIVDDIVNLGEQVGIDLKKDDIKEGLEFDHIDLSGEDLIEIDQERAYEEVEENNEVEGVNEKPKNLASDQLGMIISKSNELFDLKKLILFLRGSLKS